MYVVGKIKNLFRLKMGEIMRQEIKADILLYTNLTNGLNHHFI